MTIHSTSVTPSRSHLPRFPLAFLCLAILSACGGGGGGESTAGGSLIGDAIAQVPASVPITWSTAVAENQTFSVSGPTVVRYGVGDKWIQRTLTGTINCSNSFFGSDPEFGAVKSCQVLSGDVINPSPAPVASAPAPTPAIAPAPAPAPAPSNPTTNTSILSPALEAEFVDAQGVRQSVRVVSGQTTVTGVAPFLVKFDASDTRASAAFRAQSAITDPEAYAFLMAGYRLNYGENRGGVWQYPQGSSHSRDEDTGPPVFSYVYQTPGSYPVRLRTRDALGNEATVLLNVVVNAPPAPVLIRPTDGRWPNFVSGTRYGLQANGDYRSFGALETGGRHNIVIEKVGSGADPRIATFSPDGRSKFAATRQMEYRAAHIRLVNVDIDHVAIGQRGFDYVGVIGGLVRRFSDGGAPFLWNEHSVIHRTNVRTGRGLFFQDTELRSTTAGSGYIIFGTFNGLHARNTRFVHVENGPTTYAMLRVYGSNFTFRNNLWYSEADGGSANGTLISMLAVAGQSPPIAWRDDDMVGPVDATSNSQAYGYISEKQILQNNQMYAPGSNVTNAIAAVGGGNPSGAIRIYPRLIGMEDNVFYSLPSIAIANQNGQLAGQYAFWRNNRRNLGAGSFVSATTAAPNQSVGDSTTYTGPFLNESANSRPTPSRF